MELKKITEFKKIVAAENSIKEVIIFKYSPVCPISRRIEIEFDKWIEINNLDIELFKINVITSRELSNHIANYFSIIHESPQLIWLNKQFKVKASKSHFQINDEFLNGNL